MAKGWIRAWADETARVVAGDLRTDKDRSRFRKSFTTPLRAGPDASSDVLTTLKWGDDCELPNGIQSGTWSHARANGQEGFIATRHVIEVGYVNTTSGADAYTAELTLANGQAVKLLWGDLVQITERSGQRCEVRARGRRGTIDAARLTSDPLLEVYFVDVGQGDGVLVRLPSGRHMLIDGGLPRAHQMTGKNVADFVDWKFHDDYGHYRVSLDAMIASHSDYDHYGGLWDLVRMEAAEDNELSCIDVAIGEFCHPGLSRWENRPGANPPHKDSLGPNEAGWFIRLLGDRADAEASTVNGAANELGGDWKNFIADILQRNAETTFSRLGVGREILQGGGPLPRFWSDDSTVNIQVLAPVTADRDGTVALKDLGDTGQNTNGHSICLRLDYRDARVLLTGDLNKKSMEWIIDSYGDRISAFNCDAVKACHHGSGDISYKFLEHVKAGATIVSSGDAEGFAHPRPEVVAASAVTGHMSVDRNKDKLITPLVYMTEIERSVSLGQVSHIKFGAYPASGGSTLDGALFGMPSREIADKALLTDRDRQAIAKADDTTAKQLERDAIQREKNPLRELDANQIAAKTRGAYHYRTVHELFSIQYGNKSVWRSRIMTKNHYGLVNVRTDGKTIICATMTEAGDGWTVHSFPARFGSQIPTG
jgi:beta-lactamase superfamily II metal-dependent hydrolase